MWANEPKIIAFPLGNKHAVLAEDFFARTWTWMQSAYEEGNLEEAKYQ